MVQPSPWPLFTAISLSQLIMVCLYYFHYMPLSKSSVIFSFTLFFTVIGMWFRDVTVEATFQGQHTIAVQQGLRLGFVFVLLSEAMFFFGFFWCFFYMSLSPSIWIGCCWPPLGIKAINPFGLPWFNTWILLSSGVSGTYAHRAMTRRDGRYQVMFGLSVTVVYGVLFTAMQLWEYTTAPFSISDGIYGSIFFVSTGFHGLHVIIGTIALFVCLIRHINYHFHIDHHVGLELSMWYWHFVDVIWILLFLSIYLWGYHWK